MEATSSSSYFGSLTFEQVLDDLSSRFIVNLPAEELESIERICFQIEQAHWYYEDFVRPQASHLPSFSLRKFSEIIFKSNPLLSHFDAATAYDQFLRYKERVPVCGAILISSSWDKCLVVKGWKSGASWSFPRGKINQGEDERDCAVREVWEETGYDISPHFNPSVTPHPSNSSTCPPPLPSGQYPDDDYLECIMKEQRIRLYLVPNVSEDTLFETKTRKEISKIAWAPFTSLPTWSKKSKNVKKELKCYMVTPFVNPLKEWIKTRRKQQAQRQKLPGIDDVQREEGSAVLAEHHIVDDQLAAKTQELQEFFFGNQSPVPQPASGFEPLTANTSAQSTKKATKTVGQPHHPAPLPQATSPFQTTYAALSTQQGQPISPMQAQYLRNIDVLSPHPQTPGRPADTLHRLVMRRGQHEQPSQAPSTVDTSSSSANTAKAPFTHQRYSSYVPSPSFTEYRNSALSPSTFEMYPNRVVPAKPRTYTEAERDEVRNDLLNQLANQLGTPTPPSADEGTDGTTTSEEEEERVSRQATPVLDLLALVQQQLHKPSNGGASAPVPAPTFRQTTAVNLAMPTSQGASQPNLQHRPSQHILNILNGNPTRPQPVQQDQHQLNNSTAAPLAKSSPQQHVGRLLNLFNARPPNANPMNNQSTPTMQGDAGDLARLFANVRT